MTYPKKIQIHELGPREGMQIEKNHVSTEEKVRLIDMLSECQFPEIEVVSFVNPKWVPQMADAENIVAKLNAAPNTKYTGVYLNIQGMNRAIATKKLFVEGSLSITASETFSKKNTNRSIDETFEEAQRRIDAFKISNIPATEISVMAAFGCNYEGNVDPEKVVQLIARLMELAEENEYDIKMIQLCDTMGWANPQSVKYLVGKIQDRWSKQKINLHLHDTRGMGMANAIAALEMGVDDFDAAVAGLGGCPYAGFKDAPGNIATEDLVHMCHELGIETGVNLERLVEVAVEAEKIVGHPLPGKVMRGGRLDAYRHTARNQVS